MQLRFKPDAQTFSCVENVWHLRDIEIEGYARRLRRTLEEDHPTLPDLDGTRMAIERWYNEQPVATALAEFAAARRANVERLRSVTLMQLARTAMMETVGEVTLAQILQMWREHDAGHRRDFAELRRLLAAR
jgi:hypothetical protein